MALIGDFKKHIVDYLKHIVSASSAPSVSDSSIYYDTTAKKHYMCQNGAWVEVNKINDGSITNVKLAITSTYIAPDLLNSWVNYASGWNVAGYFKDTNNVVHIKGLVKNGTSASAVIFILPVGYRPLSGMLFATESVDAICRLNVNSDGTITLGTGGNTAWVSINCSFLAEQ